ncbi:MAG: hypothetical protein COA69_01620 [Robiginitomaculum sp.]|nr:MAG: hypothetical protein COA69_01620 [Robiginitomaculum sp.]
MALIDLVAPVVEPVDLTSAKQFLRVDGNDEDTLITDMISLARHQVENMIDRTLIYRVFMYRGPVPNGHCLQLPRPPLLAVSEVTLRDEDEQIIVIPSSDYRVNTHRDPGELRLKDGVSWTDYLDAPTGLEIEFSAGYGTDPGDVPLPLKQALLLLLAQHYEYRDNTEHPSVPMMVDALLMPYRWVRL